MSRAGAVILKIAVMVRVDPMPIRSRHVQKATTSQTALTGVWVRVFTFDQKLGIVSMWLCVGVGLGGLGVRLGSAGWSLPGEGERSVSRERPCHACVRQHSAAAGEELNQHDEEPHDCASRLATSIEEDLGHRHSSRRRHDRIVV